MTEGLFWTRERSRLPLYFTKMCAVIPSALVFCLALLVVPVSAQDGPELTRALIDQRIAALRKEGIADSDEPLKSYRAAESWLGSAQLHKSDAARYIGELTEAPRREARIQARLDAAEPVQEVDEDLDSLTVQELEAELLLNQTAKRDARETRDILDRQLGAAHQTIDRAPARRTS